jgi:hypothetical protein
MHTSATVAVKLHEPTQEIQEIFMGTLRAHASSKGSATVAVNSEPNTNHPSAKHSSPLASLSLKKAGISSMADDARPHPKKTNSEKAEMKSVRNGHGVRPLMHANTVRKNPVAMNRDSAMMTAISRLIP